MSGPVGADDGGATRARIALVAGPLLALLVLALPLPLAPEAHRLAAIMAVVVAFWIGEPIPAPVTALLGPTAALLFGALPPGLKPKEAVELAYGRFGDPILMLFLGGFFIAEAMTVHGLDKRMAMRILSVPAVGASPGRMVLGLGLVACLLSMWVSNTATTALLIPIAMGMLKVARGDAKPGRLDVQCLLMLSFSATVGGLATPVGTAPNLIGLGQLESLGKVKVGFLSWMGLALPLCALMMAALALLLTRGLPPAAADLTGHARKELAALGPWRRGEAVAATSFGVAVSLWLGAGLVQLLPADPRLPRVLASAWWEGHLPEGAIGLLAASLLFLIPAAPGRPTLTWREASRIDWGTLLLLGGGLSLGVLVQRTGLAEAIGKGVVGGLGLSSEWGIVLAAAALGVALSEMASNTATATLLVPVVIGIAQEAKVSPVAPALAATFACSFGFMLPVSTPPNALVYATGLVPIGTMARRGAVFDAVGFVLLAALMPPLVKLVLA